MVSVLLCVYVIFYQERGEDILTVSEGKKRKYLDFIDILLEARVSLYESLFSECVAMTSVCPRMMRDVV